ncbi:sensor histidine kinase [Arundinibacter roseus]|nr:histidine kinase [Arundinibacter roseus]
MDLLRFQTNLWWRNCLFFGLIGIVLLGFNWEGFWASQQNQPGFVLEMVTMLVLIYSLCLTHNVILYERFLRQRRFGLYALGIAGLLLIWICLDYFFSKNQYNHWLNSVLSGWLLILFGWGLYLIYYNVFLANRQLKTQLYSSRNEVSQLRSQMNPHFLFNALNNLYGVSVSEPERVPDFVLLLSDLLRYQIQSSMKEWVTLVDEVHFLNQFVQYERDKLGHRGSVSWQVHIPDPAVQVAPLLLFPFLENAFKYSCQLTNPCVQASLSVSNDTLLLTCQNTFNPDRRVDNSSTQLGIFNTRQRLDLLYPNGYTLAIRERNNTYAVRLLLNLNRYAS